MRFFKKKLHFTSIFSLFPKDTEKVLAEKAADGYQCHLAATEHKGNFPLQSWGVDSITRPAFHKNRSAPKHYDNEIKMLLVLPENRIALLAVLLIIRESFI